MTNPDPQNSPSILKKVDTEEKLENFLKKKKKAQKITITTTFYLGILSQKIQKNINWTIFWKYFFPNWM